MCLVDGVHGAFTERRVALTERTFGVWHGHVPGVRAGQRYGYRVHGPYRPWEGPRANPAKILVDPYARRITGAVTNLEAARGWAIDPMTGPPSTVDSLGHVPLSVRHRAGRADHPASPGRPVVRDGDHRGARPRLHQAAPGGAARAPRHLPRPGPPGRRRAPAPDRGDGRRAAARHRDARRAAAARTRPPQLLGLLDARLLRPAPGLRERARRGGRGVRGDGRRAARRRHRGAPRRGAQPHLRGRRQRHHRRRSAAWTRPPTTPCTAATTPTSPAPATRSTPARRPSSGWCATPCGTGRPRFGVDGFRVDLASVLGRPRSGPFDPHSAAADRDRDRPRARRTAS